MKSKRLMAIILATVLVAGCGKSGNSDTNDASTQERTAQETTSQQDIASSNNMTDEEKQQIIDTVAEKRKGTVTCNNYDIKKVMTGTQFFKLRFDSLESQELLNAAEEAFGLSAEQYIEDYETFWSILKENYPFYGVLSRENVDLDEFYEDGKKIIEAYPTARTLYNLIEDLTSEIFNAGHLAVILPNSYEELKSVYANYSPWNEMYTQDSVINNLENWGKYMDYENAHFMDLFDVPDESEDLIKEGRQYEEDNGLYLPEITGEVEENSAYPSNDNVKTNIIEDGKVAYISLADFSTWDDDKEVLDEFMGQISNCTDLILDIRYNGGGDDNYWYNLVSYLSEESNLTYSKYALTNLTETNKEFIESGIGLANLQPIEDLPEELNVEKSDLENVTHFTKMTVDVNGNTEYCGYTGKIWLITSPYVYSASEDFAMFCKENKFATLIGTCTGGDGCAMDPINIALPNTGLMFRFSTFNVLNADGSNNEENGTTPDILLNDGDNVIDAILEQIK